MPGLGLQLEVELDAEELKLGQGAAQHGAGAARRGISLLAHREPPFSRPPASAFRLPPFPRNLSPARLHPGPSLGGEAPGRCLVSLLPRSLGSQLPFFFSWSGSHPLRSPSSSSGSLLLPLARVPAAQPLFSAEGPRLPFSLPAVHPHPVPSSVPRVLPLPSPTPFPRPGVPNLLVSSYGPNWVLVPLPQFGVLDREPGLLSTSRGLLPQKHISQT